MICLAASSLATNPSPYAFSFCMLYLAFINCFAPTSLVMQSTMTPLEKCQELIVEIYQHIGIIYDGSSIIISWR